MIKLTYPLYLVQAVVTNPALHYVELKDKDSVPVWHMRSGESQEARGFTVDNFLTYTLGGEWLVLTDDEINEIKEKEKPLWPKYIVCSPKNNLRFDITKQGFDDCLYIIWENKAQAFTVAVDGTKKKYSVDILEINLRRGDWVETTKEQVESYPKQETFPVYFSVPFYDRTLFVKFVDKNNYKIINKKGIEEKDSVDCNLEIVRKYAGWWKLVPNTEAEDIIKATLFTEQENEKKRHDLADKLIEQIRGMDLENLAKIKL